MLDEQDIAKAREIPLDVVFERFGAKRDPKDPKNNWKTHAGRISTTGSLFYNHDSENGGNRAKGGNGAIDLSMHLGEMSFYKAVNWLKENIDSSLSVNQDSPIGRPVAIAQNKVRGITPIPEHVASRLPQVIKYLTEVRQIPAAIVNHAIEHKRVQADKFGNAMFSLCDLHGNKIGAELRGTFGKPFHSVRGKKGFFFAGSPQPKVAVFVESSIEALSYLALRDTALVIGTVGGRRVQMEEAAIHFHARGYKIVDGFNPDKAGEAQGKALASYVPNVDRHRPTKGTDWNDELKITGPRTVAIDKQR